MKDRIKQIRKGASLTVQEFADSLNISKSAVEAYEYRGAKMSDRTIADICRIYNINEEWLRTGEGEMYAPQDRVSEIADITASLMKSNEPLRLKIAKLLASLTDEQIAEARAIMEELLKEENRPE